MSGKIEAIQGDITILEVDAIVNAAKESLLGGGGVDGAIHRAAGTQLLAECRSLGGCKTGQAKITQGYNLPAKYVIHTVGPIWRGGGQNEPELLKSCYESCFNLAVENGVKTIAFPAISCGVYRYPVEAAVHIAIASTLAFLQEDTTLEKVIFVCFDADVYSVYLKAQQQFDL